MNELVINEYRKSITEVNYILMYTDSDILKKIPLKFKKFLEENEALDYCPEIDIAKPLKNQKLKKYTLSILGLIYRDYICDNNQKEEYKKILEENQRKLENERNEKYSYEKLFYKKNKISEEEVISNNLPAVVKSNFFVRIKNKLLSIFKRKEI